MERLTALLGREGDLDEVARQLHGIAGDMRASVVGALLLTCSDESERECAEAFQRQFAEPLLPSLKFGERSVFRIANLGARYERGAVHIAEDHYALAQPEDGFKLLVVKLNAHVAVNPSATGLEFGRMQRYRGDSVACGALHALMDQARLPFAEELRRVFTWDGDDRVATLLDARKVAPENRSLFVAVAGARLQSRRVLADIQGRRPERPTLFIVLPCVTLNRATRDTEIVCGAYQADWRGEEPSFEYQGLGDDPARYRLDQGGGRLVIHDPGGTSRRPARDHRDLQ